MIAGRPPFPRIAPPYRRGVDEVVDDADGRRQRQRAGRHRSRWPARPTAAADARGQRRDARQRPRHHRQRRRLVPRASAPTSRPGTIVCTVSGSTTRAGVGEVAMGTPLAEVIDAIGGGVPGGRRIVAVLSGVANAAAHRRRSSTRRCQLRGAWRRPAAASARPAFIVFDDDDRPRRRRRRRAAVPRRRVVRPVHPLQAGRPRDRVGPAHGRGASTGLLATVTDEARCALAGQHQTVVASLLALAGERPVQAVAPFLIAELVDIDAERQSDLRRDVRREAARLDLRRDRLRAVAGRPPDRQARD